MGPRCPGKANYPEWEYQASDWPSVSCWMTVRMTTFYHYFYVSPASHSCRNTQKKDSIWRFCRAQGLHNPSPRCNVLEDSPDRNRDGPELILLLKLVPIQMPWVGAVDTMCSPCHSLHTTGIRSVTPKHLTGNTPPSSKSTLVKYSGYDSVHVWRVNWSGDLVF